MKETQLRVLADRGTYLGKRLQGTVEETHISWVILTRLFAFKVKKPLKYSFLDFSTLSKRRKYCEKEVALNQRFSHIYLGVVPVRYQRGEWRLGTSQGTIVDYAVQMKRMRSSKRMDFLLQSGKVRRANIVSLARLISAFHARATLVTSPFNLRFSRKAFNDIRVTRTFISTAFSGKYLSIVAHSIPWSNSFLKNHKERFRQRAADGFKRDVHGDLHSGNIFIYHKPVIFDCIEFNDEFRQIDVLDEIAFFCMDLEAHGQKHLSEAFVEEYSRRFPCFQRPEDRHIFNYYKCYRANVRAKVHALAAKQETDPVVYSRHTEWVKKYLLLMEQYMGYETR